MAMQDKSLNALERDAERRRAELADTVGVLRDRVSETMSPAHIKGEVKNYVQSSSDQFVRRMEQRIRDNPLQTLAVGAGLAWPLLRLARAMPAPLLLVGAGLALAKSAAPRVGARRGIGENLIDGLREQAATASDAIGNATDELSSRARSAYADASQRTRAVASDLSTRAGDAASNLVAQASRVAGDLSDRALDLADQAAGKVDDLRYRARGTAEDVANVAKGALTNAADRARDTVGAAAGTLQNSLADASGRVQDLSGRVQDKAVGLAERGKTVAGDLAARARGEADSAARAVAGASGTIRTTAGYQADEFSDAASYAAGRARQAMDRAGAQGSSAYAKVTDQLQDTWGKTRQAASDARRTATDTLEKNPLILLGLGVAIGGLIAAALPVSDAEERVLGPAGKNLKSAATGMINDQIDAGKTLATRTLGTVLDAAKEQGLSIDALQQSASAIDDKIKSVAQKASGKLANDDTPHRDNETEQL